MFGHQLNIQWAAAYASGENYAREDDSNYYDKWFNGTSSADLTLVL